MCTSSGSVYDCDSLDNRAAVLAVTLCSAGSTVAPPCGTERAECIGESSGQCKAVLDCMSATPGCNTTCTSACRSNLTTWTGLRAYTRLQQCTADCEGQGAAGECGCVPVVIKPDDYYYFSTKLQQCANVTGLPGDVQCGSDPLRTGSFWFMPGGGLQVRLYQASPWTVYELAFRFEGSSQLFTLGLFPTDNAGWSHDDGRVCGANVSSPFALEFCQTPAVWSLAGVVGRFYVLSRGVYRNATGCFRTASSNCSSDPYETFANSILHRDNNLTQFVLCGEASSACGKGTCGGLPQHRLVYVSYPSLEVES